jgi:hypothetical protein
MNRFTIEITIESSLTLMDYVYHSKNCLDDYYSFYYDEFVSYDFYLAILAVERNFLFVPIS